jgi:hypothetical protein
LQLRFGVFAPEQLFFERVDLLLGLRERRVQITQLRAEAEA